VVELDLEPPYAHAPVLAALAAHAVPGVEVTDLTTATHRRLLVLGGRPVAVTVTFGADRVTAHLATTEPTAVTAARAVIRRWLDLDAEPARVAGVLGADPVIGPLVALRPGLRVLGHPDGFEAAVCTVLGQQVSVAAARTFAARLVAACGEPGATGLGLFPRPEAVAAAGPAELQRVVGLTHARSRTVHALALACAAGLEISATADPDDVRARLLGVPGIGPWTVDYLAVRVLGDRDAYPAGDLVVQRALGVTSARAAREASRAWWPLRAYAAFHLWTHQAYLGGSRS
jgi:3-methyladenine DNA glycosylase/8-oxoguanine DNA glycosylase